MNFNKPKIHTTIFANERITLLNIVLVVEIRNNEIVYEVDAAYESIH